MQVQSSIEARLVDQLAPDHLEVINESDGHNVPRGSETHFKVVIVSDHFEGERLVARHRRINHLLADQLAGPVHALALHTLTRAEWEQRYGAVPESPHCRGGTAAAQAAGAEPPDAGHD